jgi:hypothetical protein
MKFTRTFVAVALVLGLSVGLAYAKKPDTTPKPKKEPEPLVGTVLKVDGPKIVIQTRGKTAGEVTVVTDAKTAFEVKGKTAAITDLKPGQQVVVTPPTGTAQKIVVAEDGKGKGKGGKKKDDKK